jgi:hypothetical protein
MADVTEMPEPTAPEPPIWLPDMRTVITLMLLSAAIVLAFAFALGHAVVPDSDIGKMAITTVFTLATLSVQYYVGSSRQQAMKDETIKQQARTQAVTASTAATVATTAATVATAAAGIAPVNGAIEAAAWADAIAKNTKQAFEDYLTKFPTGMHAAEARTKIAAM